MARITKEEKDQRKKMAFLLSYLVNEKKHADKITQKTIARQLLVDPKTITNWTTGKSVPPVNQYEFIAKYFGYDKNIFDRLDDAVESYKDLDDLIVRYRINEKVMKEYKITFLNCEERQETNLEHFRGTVVFDKANGVVHINLINGWGKSYSDDKGVIDWLLSPYEEPKPKFKLTQFEYDLLKCYEFYGDRDGCRISDFWQLNEMHEKGYFKGIPTNETSKYILANCEVVDGE